MNNEQRPLVHRVADTLRQLNDVYGKGVISNVHLYLSGTIEFTQTPQGCIGTKKRGRLVGNTVYALRHQRKVATQ